MVSETPTDGRCNAPAWLDDENDTKEGYCENYPKKEDGEPINGRCRMHGANLPPGPEGNDYAVASDGGAAPVGNNNAETHGMTAEAENWFENHRSEVSDPVRNRVSDLVSKANVDWNDRSLLDMLVEVAIHEEQMRQGDEYIQEEGVIVQTKKVAGDDVVVVDTENPAFRAKSRLYRDNIKALKEFGVLVEAPDAKAAAAEEEIAKAWEDALEAADEKASEDGGED